MVSLFIPSRDSSDVKSHRLASDRYLSIQLNTGINQASCIVILELC